MAIILTILLDIFMAGLFIFRELRGDQIIFVFSIVLQGMVFIDLLAIILLKPKQLFTEEKTDEKGTVSRQQLRRKTKPKRFGLFWTRLSCLLALGLLAYYVYSFLYLFIL